LRARDICELIDDYEAALPPGGWPNWFWETMIDRASRARRPGSSRIAAMLLLTLRGTANHLLWR